ncbi:MAG: mechanosensitive ion channel family protein, partial [Longimicrobiales bacterium]|nr:mechanosensitive ion channel family protein [Longimicrobiales bacterium]
QILSLIGIVLSAGVALSSTTFLGNMLGGLMLRAVKSFRAGDFIEVEGHFGRVSERGLFHTEIQTENRELTTLPNLFLVTNPVTTVRSSGTVVFATVSLGYDVSHVRIEALLREAASRAGLTDAFVLVQELGDFSVTYRVAGVLTNVESLITARSRLRMAVLDALHDGGVEIVSPTFMNQRRLEAEDRFIPKVVDWTSEPTPGAAVPEDVVFDKAREAESREKLEGQLEEIGDEIEKVEAELEAADEATRPRLEKVLEGLRRRRDRMLASIEAGESGSGSRG